MINEQKKYLFSIEERKSIALEAVKSIPNAIVISSTGMLWSLAKELSADAIVKGYRNDRDLEWERYQAEYNMKHGGYETELIKCDDAYECISSTLVRERLLNGDDASELLPESVLEYIKSLQENH